MSATVLRDVVIVGAGPVGAALAVALRDADLDVVVVDARPAQGTLRADRSLALSHGARLIFERLGIWGDLVGRADALTPIIDIDISQAHGFGMARLRAGDEDLPALGYVVSYRALQEALDAALQRTRSELRYGQTVTHVGGTRSYAAVTLGEGVDPLLARMVVVADGGGATVARLSRRRHDYHQSALIAKVWCRAPHRGVAYERFTEEGPVALLPEQDHYGLVWTAAPKKVEALLGLPDPAFLATLGERFGPRRTDFCAVADRRSFPLALEVAPSVVATRCAVIGNAAQALHPVAGQGFNLGLRDAYQLARSIIDVPRAEIGSDRMLRGYARARRADRLGGVAFTHGLLGLFANDFGWLRWPRGLALSLLDAMPPAKRLFTRAMLFGLR